MKKTWTAPRIEFLHFQANDYVSACENVFTLICNAIGAIYLNTTSNSYDGLQYDYQIGGKQNAAAFYDAFKTENSFTPREQLDYDLFYNVVDNPTKYPLTNMVIGNYDQVMNTTPSACGTVSTKKYTMTEINNLRKGYAYNAYAEDDTREVVIWHNGNGNGFHATYVDTDNPFQASGRNRS